VSDWKFGAFKWHVAWMNTGYGQGLAVIRKESIDADRYGRDYGETIWASNSRDEAIEFAKSFCREMNRHYFGAEEEDE
jgi:hypothetical protein